jgi:rhodanese-related sulfurtransferase
MLNQKISRLMLVLLLALAFALNGCGGAAQPAAPADNAAPLAAMEQTPPAEAPAQEAAAKPVEAATFDLDAAVGSYLSNIPEGFMSVGKLEDFKTLLDSSQVVLVDVRETKEYDEGHFPGAINIPIRTLADNLNKIPADKPVVVYCASGHRAGMATTALQLLGYKNVKAGPTFKAWAEANEVVSTEPVEATPYFVPQLQPELLAAVKGFLSNLPDGYLAVGDMEKFKDAVANGAFLVDVREISEYDAGHLPNAINIPIRTLADNLDRVPTDRPVFVYCKSGHRAALSTAALQLLGYTNVRAFPPGFAGWEKAGEPLAMVQ